MRGWEQLSAERLSVCRGPIDCACQLPMRGLCSQAPMAAPGPLLSPPCRSRRLEEEQQMALAALSQQLEAITDVEELTKLVSDRVPGADRVPG